LSERYEWVCSRYKNEPYYTIPVLTGPRGAWVFDKQWFSGTQEMDFEGLKVPVPSGWHEVLIATYPEGLLEPEKDYSMSDSKPEIIIDTANSYGKYVSRYSDMLKDIDNKQVFLFGAADSLRIWLERYGKGLNVVCTFDNAESKWGTSAYGIPVRSPNDIKGLIKDDSRLIVTSLYHKEIGKQLDNMNIEDYYIFIDGWNYTK